MNQCLAGRLVALLALALVLQACASTSAPPVETDAPPTFIDEYLVGIGDSLSVNIWRNPDLSVSVPVRPDGRISMPLLGDVDVGGKTPETIAEEIEQGLADYVRDPQVSVIVNSVGSNEYVNRVRVTGAVRSPVSLPYRPGMTVMDVILEAGGPTEFANRTAARLYRQGSAVREIDLRAILDRGDLSTNYRLQPGDVLTVPQSVF